MRAPAAFQIIHRSLLRALDPTTAADVLSDACDAVGAVPETPADTLAMVRGPMRGLLEQRVSPRAAHAVIELIENALCTDRLDDPDTAEVEDERLVEQTRQGDDATARFATEIIPVRAVVVASGRRVVRALSSLGEESVIPVPARSIEQLRGAMHPPPPFVLVDASDFPAIAPDEIFEVTARLPAYTTRVLFGSELPFGRTFAQSIALHGRIWVTLQLRNGMGPLLDLVRARRQ